MVCVWRLVQPVQESETASRLRQTEGNHRDGSKTAKTLHLSRRDRQALPTERLRQRLICAGQRLYHGLAVCEVRLHLIQYENKERPQTELHQRRVRRAATLRQVPLGHAAEHQHARRSRLGRSRRQPAARPFARLLHESCHQQAKHHSTGDRRWPCTATRSKTGRDVP